MQMWKDVGAQQEIVTKGRGAWLQPSGGGAEGWWGGCPMALIVLLFVSHRGGWVCRSK